MNVRAIVAWTLYDFANSAFAAVIFATIYAAYYALAVVGNEGGAGDLWWGRVVSVSMGLVALTSPFLGGVADRAGIRRLVLRQIGPMMAAGIVVGVVDSNSRDRPVRVVPFLSFTTDVIGWVLFGFTTTLVPVLVPVIPGTLNVIEVGGHVAKKPAELPAFDIFAVITVDPGCCAVATPFWSIVTTEGVCAT